MFNEFMELLTVKPHLKPITCKACKDDGYRTGVCEKCLKNQAWNREWLLTHPFIYDTTFRGYHTDRHCSIKQLPLRLANEHPYLFYGIEIEVEFDSGVVSVYDEDDYDTDEDDNWKINEILDEFSNITQGLFIYEHDSSLDNGVEMISRPCSYAFWTAESTVKMLKEGFEFLKEHGAYTDQPTSNGLHIHLSRKFFDFGNATKNNPSLAYQGFDWLFQKFQPEIEKLGGREYTQYCASKAEKARTELINGYTKDQLNADVEIKCKIKKGGVLPDCDHHSAITLSGNTIEARVFKSTIDYREVLSYIEIVRNIAHAVRDENIERTFDDILHTKDNLYLDEHIQRTKMKCAKNKETLDMDKMNDNELEVMIEV